MTGLLLHCPVTEGGKTRVIPSAGVQLFKATSWHRTRHQSRTSPCERALAGIIAHPPLPELLPTSPRAPAGELAPSVPGIPQAHGCRKIMPCFCKLCSYLCKHGAVQKVPNMALCLLEGTLTTIPPHP